MLSEIIENENRYKEYINTHKLNVQKAWESMKANKDCMDLIATSTSSTNLNTYIGLLNSMIENHDASKYSIEEFDAYRKNFYPVSPEEKEQNKEAFDLAWKHHYTNNLHHWNWWYESGNTDKMSIPYVIEMICDWEAMGYVFGNNSKEFYEANKHKIHLGNRQKEFAEKLMSIICK